MADLKQNNGIQDMQRVQDRFCTEESKLQYCRNHIYDDLAVTQTTYQSELSNTKVSHANRVWEVKTRMANNTSCRGYDGCSAATTILRPLDGCLGCASAK
eukprot:2297892-Amphidinium_carterae.1